MKVKDLFDFYYKDLFRLIIEYRDSANYFIQECRYEDYNVFLKYDRCKDKTIRRWFITRDGADNKIVIVLED